MKKSSGFVSVIVLCILLALTGCSDSDSDDVSTVTGIASSGAPVAGTITLKDASGETLGPIDIESDGAFSFNVTGYTPPFVLKATATVGGDSWYSYSRSAGQVNVNPLTSLIVASAAEASDPANVYEDATDISDDTLDTAVQAVQAVFANLFTSFGVDAGFNPFSGDCTVNHVGIDALFDAVDIAIDTNTGAVSVTARDSTSLVETTTTGIDAATPITAGAAADAASQVPWVGTYNYCELFLDTPMGGSGASAAAGRITLEADGTWTAVNEASSGDLAGSFNGTYAIDARGRLWVDNTEYGIMTPDAQVAIVTDLNASEGLDVGLTVLCKRDATLEVSDISGAYVVMSLYRDTVVAGSGASGETATVVFNGAGTFTGGTYSVDEYGRFTVVTVDGTEDYGMVAKNGDVIVLPDYDPDEGQDVGISILIRTSTLAGWGDADLSSDYNFAEMYAHVDVNEGSSEDAVNAAGGTLSFDGAGAYAGTVAYSSAGEAGAVAGSYETLTGYSGVTLNCFTADGIFGISTPDTELFAVPDDDAEEGLDVGITLGVKAW